MSTPNFNPTVEQFGDVRLYTEMDPYYYTIDNRPLQDLSSNAAKLGASADAARRAALIEAMCSSAVYSGVFGSAQKLVGLKATATTSSTITVDPGVMLSPGSISAGDGRQVLRAAASPLPVVLNCPAPVTLGREFTYVVQVQFKDISGAITYPNYDSTNAFLPPTLLNGFLDMNVVVGAEANTGASVAPSVTPGWTPLYTVVSVAGASYPVLTVSASAPDRSVGLGIDGPWISPTLTNSWVQVGGGYQAIQYRKTGNRIQIRGSISSGTANAAAFTLPAGYRPLTYNAFGVSSGTSTSNTVIIASSGTVTPTASATIHFGIIEFYID